MPATMLSAGSTRENKANKVPALTGLSTSDWQRDKGRQIQSSLMNSFPGKHRVQSTVHSTHRERQREASRESRETRELRSEDC